MLMKKNIKRQRLIAWIAVIGVSLVMLTLIFVAFLLLKDPVSEKIAEAIPHQEEAEEVVEEESEPQTVPEEGEAISEESLEEIFGNLEEEPEEIYEEPEEDTVDEELEAQAAEILEGMSLEDQVAQLFFITPEALTGVDVVTAAGQKTKESLDEHPVGGIILFGHNIEDPDQLQEMTGNLIKYSMERVSLPIFIGIDEEGGSVTRIASNSEFDVPKVDSMLDIGRSSDPHTAYEAGHTIGTYLSENGINVNFAPDADVLMEDVDSVIGDRAFGYSPEVVADMSAGYLEGLTDAGIIGVAKHFPGHGGVSNDTHKGTVVTDKTWGELSEMDLIPFERLISENVPMIMVSHISAPEVTAEEVPSSMSSIMITQKLRVELGYKGIVITDAMNMGAVSSVYSSDEAAIASLKAGADIILTPKDFEEAYNGVLSAVENGDITQERISESVLRIIRLKLKLGYEG